MGLIIHLYINFYFAMHLGKEKPGEEDKKKQEINQQERVRLLLKYKMQKQGQLQQRINKWYKSFALDKLRNQIQRYCKQQEQEIKKQMQEPRKDAQQLIEEKQEQDIFIKQWVRDYQERRQMKQKIRQLEQERRIQEYAREIYEFHYQPQNRIEEKKEYVFESQQSDHNFIKYQPLQFSNNLRQKWRNRQAKALNDSQSFEKRYYIQHKHLIGRIKCYDQREQLHNGMTFMISPRVAITAAHNVYFAKDGLCFGRGLTYINFLEKQIGIEKVLVNKTYQGLKEQNIKKDYCLLTLEQKVNNSPFITLCINFEISETPIQLWMIKLIKISKSQQSTLGIERQKISKYFVVDNMIKYQSLPRQGMSGAIIVLKHGYQEQIHYATIGMHIGRRLSYSSALLITKDMIQDILSKVSHEDREAMQVFDYQRKEYISKQVKGLLALSAKRQDYDQFYPNSPEQLNKILNLNQLKRLGEYINFRIGSRFYEYVTVNNTRLFYDQYNQQNEYGLQHLSLQYQQLAKMNLRHNNYQHKSHQHIQSRRQKQELQNSLNMANMENFRQENKDKQLDYNKNDYFIQESSVFSKTLKCKINVNLFGSQQSRQQVYSKDFTFKEIVQSIRVKYKIHSNLYQVKGKYKAYTKDNYTKVIKSLSTVQEQYLITFFKEQCYFGPSNLLFLIKQKSYQNQEKNQNYQLFKKSLQELSDKLSSFSTLGFSEDFNICLFNMNVSLKNARVRQYYTLTYKVGGQITHLQCTKGTIFIKVPLELVPVQLIRKGDNIKGVSLNSTSLKTTYTIQSIQLKNNENSTIFYSLSAENAQYFIGNHLLIRCQESFQIEVKYPENHQKQTEYIEVYHRDRIKDVFDSDCRLFFAGKQLQHNLTFADYNIYQTTTISCYFKNQILVNQNDDKGFGGSPGMVCAITFVEKSKPALSYQYELLSQINKFKCQQHYLGIVNSRILPLQSSEFASIRQYNTNINVVAVQKAFLGRCYFLQKMQKFEQKPQNEFIREYQNVKNENTYRNMKNKNKHMEQEDIFPLFIYTYTRKNYCYQINDSLRNYSIYNNNKESFKLLGLANKLSKSLKKLPPLNLLDKDKKKKIFYRGVARQWGEMFKSQVNKLIIFEGFTSVSTNLQVAKMYASDRGVIFQIQTVSGKSIKDFTFVKDEDQALLEPYCSFIIQSYSIVNGLQWIKLKEIPLPCTNSKNIIFWVEDNPQNNNSIKKQISKDIEVVDVSCTEFMRAIFREFFWVYRYLDKKVMVISDMTRMEGEVLNGQAGAEVIATAYNELGLTNRIIIYTSCHQSKLNAEKAIQGRSIRSNNWKVVFKEEHVINEINNFFGHHT